MAPFHAKELISLKGPKDDEAFKKYTIGQKHRLIRKLKRKDEGAVFISGLPFGFTKTNLEKYMSQFGEVIRSMLHRSPRSGKSRGYGYVHFRYSEVARIASNTMNNYLMLGNIIKCVFVPGDQIKEEYFAPMDKTFHTKVNKAIAQVNKPKSKVKDAQLLKRRQDLAIKQLKKIGEESLLQYFDFPALGASRTEENRTTDEGKQINSDEPSKAKDPGRKKRVHKTVAQTTSKGSKRMLEKKHRKISKNKTKDTEKNEPDNVKKPTNKRSQSKQSRMKISKCSTGRAKAKKADE